MYSYITALALAGGASARVLPRGQDGCCFQLKASGEQSGMVGQLGDGQNRIGGGYEPATYCISNGAITDSNGRGCILTPPTTQFQCDEGAKPTEGFSISGQGEVEYNGSNTFYACGADKGEYNIYTKPVDGQKDCVEVKLSSSDGKCSSNGGGGGGVSSSIPAPPASTQPAGEQSTAPAGYASKGPSSSAPAASKYTPPAGVGSKSEEHSAPVETPSQPAVATSQPKPETSQPAMQTNQPKPDTSAYGAQTSQPAVETSQAKPDTSQPAVQTSQAKPETSAYGAQTSQPAVETSQAKPDTSQPAVQTSQPKPETTVKTVKTSQPAIQTSQKESSFGSAQTSQPSLKTSQPVIQTSQGSQRTSQAPQSYPAGYASSASSQASQKTSQAPQSSGPAVYASSASSQASQKTSEAAQSTGKPSGTASGSACQTSLTGAYQTPHLIVPVSSEQPDKAFGTSYNGQINSTTNTIFNFDIPGDYEGKKCSVVFLFPKKEDLETSSYEYGGSGSLSCSELSDAASQETTYSNAPSADKDLDTIELQPGNSYVVATQDCKAGETQSFELSSQGGLSLNFFQDWNPSPLGLYVTSC